MRNSRTEELDEVPEHIKRAVEQELGPRPISQGRNAPPGIARYFVAVEYDRQFQERVRKMMGRAG